MFVNILLRDISEEGNIFGYFLSFFALEQNRIYRPTIAI